MIRHSVVFRLKYPKGSSEETLFLRAAGELRKIPGIQNFELLLQTSPKTNYDYGISMEFRFKEDYALYNRHPDHTAFVATYWASYVDSFMELDYEILI